MAAGIPHYYDVLDSLSRQSTDMNVINSSAFSSIFYESSLYTSGQVKVHKYQKEIIDKFSKGVTNRYFLSASTSFGKTFLTYEIIRKLKYKNIALVFPTIALLSENLEKITTDLEYKFIKDNYKIHTLSEPIDDSGISTHNIFIFTPERFLSYLENSPTINGFDFIFIDEFYKIDNDYLIDDENKENERDVAYRIATHYSLQGDTDVLFAGPYMSFTSDQTSSFEVFLEENSIIDLDYNKIETVGKDYFAIKNRKEVILSQEEKIYFNDGSKKHEKLYSLIEFLNKENQNTIVYCSTKSGTERYPRKIIEEKGYGKDWQTSQYEDFLYHLKLEFGENWIVVKALESGIGIHHGLVPKYIQKEIIELFNKGYLNLLFSTTTITEGVNTSAKNLVVLHSKKGSKDLKRFDAKNIAGRAGRFKYHFHGRVFSLNNDFMDVIKSPPEILEHKNYDLNSNKKEIDLFYTNEKYLSEIDIVKKEEIISQQKNRNIPEEIISRFKVIDRESKIEIYDSILNLNEPERLLILELIKTTNRKSSIHFEGLQIVIDLVKPHVENEKLMGLFDKKMRSNLDGKEYSIFVYFLHFYLKGGFKSRSTIIKERKIYRYCNKRNI